MRSTIRYVDPSNPIANPNTAIPLDHFRIFLLEVQKRGLLIDQGPPEGRVAAEVGQEYMDEIGPVGAVKYIKQLADIGGDRSMGWVLIG